MEIADPRIDPQLVPEGSRAIIIAKDQPEYRALPSVVTPDGRVISRWSLTDEERRRLLQGEDLFLTISTFNTPLQPVRLTVGPIDWTEE